MKSLTVAINQRQCLNGDVRVPASNDCTKRRGKSAAQLAGFEFSAAATVEPSTFTVRMEWDGRESRAGRDVSSQLLFRFRTRSPSCGIFSFQAVWVSRAGDTLDNLSCLV